MTEALGGRDRGGGEGGQQYDEDEAAGRDTDEEGGETAADGANWAEGGEAGDAEEVEADQSGPDDGAAEGEGGETRSSVSDASTPRGGDEGVRKKHLQRSPRSEPVAA